jgi:hypothetical protein
LNTEVNCNAKVLRVYERGEILHYVRSGLRLFYPHSPNISEISFNTIHEKGNPILNHSMIKLQIGLEKIAAIDDSTPVPINKFPGLEYKTCLEIRDLAKK